jgi:hypothetical protein
VLVGVAGTVKGTQGRWLLEADWERSVHDCPGKWACRMHVVLAGPRRWERRVVFPRRAVSLR